MPLGFYRVLDQAPRVGSIIVFCPPVDHMYDFMPAGSCSHGEASYLKEVVAIEGDVVTVTKDRVTVNGTSLRDTLSIMRPGLPHAFGTWKLGPGQIWSYGAGLPALSFDSRYFGPVARQTVLVVIPIELRIR